MQTPLHPKKTHCLVRTRPDSRGIFGAASNNLLWFQTSQQAMSPASEKNLLLLINFVKTVSINNNIIRAEKKNRFGRFPPELRMCICGLWAHRIIGPHYFKNERGKVMNMNGERYRAMITGFVWPEIDLLDIGDLWFQQDGAKSHTSTEIVEKLKVKFPGRVI